MTRLVLLVLVACGAQSTPTTGGGSGSAAPTDRKTCTTDDECVLVEACCGCAAGGKRISIRKDSVEQYNTTRDQRCMGTLCTAVMSDDPSCNAEAVCREGSCAVQAHMGKL
jgi:hypothetical protein